MAKLTNYKFKNRAGHLRLHANGNSTVFSEISYLKADNDRKAANALSKTTYDILYNTVGLIPNTLLTPNTCTWATKTTNSSNTINAIAYGKGVYIYGDSSGYTETSTDGTTWANKTLASATGIKYLQYGGGVYILANNAGQYTVRTSTDGITWSNSPSNFAAGTRYARGLKYSSNSNTWVVATDNSTVFSQYSSDNGTTWSNCLGTGSSGVVDLQFDSRSNTFLSIDNRGRLYASGNGVYWTGNIASYTPISTGIHLLSCGQNINILVDNANQNILYTSNNIVGWQSSGINFGINGWGTTTVNVRNAVYHPQLNKFMITIHYFNASNQLSGVRYFLIPDKVGLTAADGPTFGDCVFISGDSYGYGSLYSNNAAICVSTANDWPVLIGGRNGGIANCSLFQCDTYSNFQLKSDLLKVFGHTALKNTIRAFIKKQ